MAEKKMKLETKDSKFKVTASDRFVMILAIVSIIGFAGIFSFPIMGIKATGFLAVKGILALVT